MEKCTHDDPDEECTHIDLSKYEIGSLSVDTMIFIETVPEGKSEAQSWYEKIKEGDVLTFLYGGEVITHRVISKIDLPSGAFEFHLMGDNRGSDGVAAEQIISTESGKRDYIIGKVVGQSEFLGWVVTTIKTPLGLIMMIFIPCIIIVIVEVVRIIGMIVADNKEKAKEKEEQAEKERKEHDATKNELDELRRQIEQAKLELQQRNAPSVIKSDEKEHSSELDGE
jgi:uncharacterized membrane protein